MNLVFLISIQLVIKICPFFLKLAENIENIKIYVGEFSDLLKFNCTIYFKEHPLNNYTGTEDQRDTISINKEYQSSFFKFSEKK